MTFASRPRLLLAVLILALFGVAIGYWSQTNSQPLLRNPTASPVIMDPMPIPGPQVARQQGNFIAGPSVFTNAQARAFAHAGLVADGFITEPPRDDAEAMRWWDWAEQAVNDQPLQTGIGATVRIGGNGTRIRRAPARSQGAEPGSGEVDAIPDQQRQVIDIRLPGTVTPTAEGQRIEGEAVFAGLRLEAGDPPLRLNDSAGRHAIRLHGENFGPVRVNGGLVIPGRTYRIVGEMVIESAGPIGVDIVPLIAAPDYHDASFQMPVAPG